MNSTKMHEVEIARKLFSNDDILRVSSSLGWGCLRKYSDDLNLGTHPVHHQVLRSQHLAEKISAPGRREEEVSTLLYEITPRSGAENIIVLFYSGSLQQSSSAVCGRGTYKAYTCINDSYM